MQRTPVSTTLREGGFFDPDSDRPSDAPPRRRPHTFAAKERLVEEVLDEAREILTHVGEDGHPVAVEALSFIHHRLFKESLNANAVYEHFHTSRFRLRFKQAVGMGVRAYIEHTRLLVAARLLSYPEIDLYLIASAVGYSHYATFFRAFKRRVGTPPSTYRETFAAAAPWDAVH